MPPITRQSLKLMIELQDRETDASGIEAFLNRLPSQAEDLEKELDTAARAFEVKKAEADSLKKQYQSLEADFEANQKKIKKRKTQLHDVKTNRDYQALLKEIEDIKAAASQIEDDMLKYLDDIEAAEVELAKAEKLYFEKKEEVNGKKQQLEENAAVQREKLEQLKVKIKHLADKLDPKLKKQYYNIKSKSGGIAIVSVNDAVCRGCHLNIPPQLYNELHTANELRFCPHCYRIIYVLS